jgi:hypothetical protein
MIVCAIMGGFAGILYVQVLSGAHDLWPETEHPIAGAVICASLVGTMGLAFAFPLILELGPSKDGTITTLVALSASMMLAGLFGFLHASLARFLIRKWEHR